MNAHRYGLLSAALLIAATAAVPDSMLAQGRGREPARSQRVALEPLSTAGGDLELVVRAARGDESGTRRTPVRALSTTQKADALRATLDLQALEPSGIGASLRLTAHKPFVANQGFVNAHTSGFVGGEKPDGYWLLAPRPKPPPATTAEGWDQQVLNMMRNLGAAISDAVAPRMEVFFKPAVANKPLLLDFAVRLREFKPVTFTIHVGGGSDWVKQEQTLSDPGDHHLLAIVVPKNTGWYSVILMPERESNTLPIWIDVDYVEITAMK